ncbi:hypothetical protein CAPTEDRAFT_219784 [Capitella teleta]|uniref:EGF-like domain-containing protein n=1 Tax=Capitella teleta TaxID=283909 RepID=R7TR68_CAPTE|nr:hypothetical protein CAPTEDRAFT_219784 [Capitella teleta]|eukprot:ELT96393.1 hypothetical protein CAPTEDRAFT_219784 [Capitella teleta]
MTEAVTSAEEEIPCIVPEGHTDPEFVRHNFGEDEPVAGPICNKTGVLVQDLYNRCEKRHCCLAKCSCDHLSTLLPESMSTCPGRSSRSEPLVYNCYMPQIMNRYYLRVCCDGYEMNDDLICVRKINCSVDNGGCEHTCVTINGQATCQCNEGYQLTNTTECQDIDECEEGNHTCEDRCINEIGFYNCSCPAGFIVEATGKCTAAPSTSAPVIVVIPNQSRQQSPDGTPSYVYLVAGLASLVILLLLLALILFLRKRRAKQLNHSASGQMVQTDAFANVIYGMTLPAPLPQGAEGRHDYEELPEVIKKSKKQEDDLGLEAEPLPDKVPHGGAAGGQDDGHYEVLPEMDKVKLDDELGVEYSKEAVGVDNSAYNVPQNLNDVPMKKY